MGIVGKLAVLGTKAAALEQKLAPAVIKLLGNDAPKLMELAGKTVREGADKLSDAERADFRGIYQKYITSLRDSQPKGSRFSLQEANEAFFKDALGNYNKTPKDDAALRVAATMKAPKVEVAQVPGVSPQTHQQLKGMSETQAKIANKGADDPQWRAVQDAEKAAQDARAAAHVRQTGQAESRASREQSQATARSEAAAAKLRAEEEAKRTADAATKEAAAERLAASRKATQDTSVANQLVDGISPKRKVIEDVDASLEGLSKHLRENNLLTSATGEPRKVKEITEAIRNGEAISIDEFRAFKSAQRSESLQSEYMETVRALERVKSSGKKGDTIAAFDRLSSLRKDADFGLEKTASSGNRPTHIEHEMFAGKNLSDGQFERIRSFYRKWFFQDQGVTPGLQGTLPGTSGAPQILSIASQMLGKMSDGKSIGVSLARKVEEVSGVGIPRIRFAVPAAFLATTALTNVDYLFLSGPEAGYGLAQMLPVTYLMPGTYKNDLSQSADLSLMSLQRHPEVFNDPNDPFAIYLKAYNANDTATMAASPLSVDQQEAVRAYKVDLPKALSESGKLKVETQQAETEAALQNSAVQSRVSAAQSANQFGTSGGEPLLTEERMTEGFNALADPDFGTGFKAEQISALKKMWAESAGRDRALSANEQDLFRNRIEADTALGMTPEMKKTAITYLLPAPAPAP
jgi:hypothetical protein